MKAWVRHRALSQGAALAFCALFSMAPILVLVLAFLLLVTLMVDTVLALSAQTGYSASYDRSHLAACAHLADVPFAFEKVSEKEAYDRPCALFWIAGSANQIELACISN
jgi:hypothetical protein